MLNLCGKKPFLSSFIPNVFGNVSNAFGINEYESIIFKSRNVIDIVFEPLTIKLGHSSVGNIAFIKY